MRRTLLLACLMLAPARADWPPPNYSVEIVFYGTKGISRTDKIYVSSGKTRVESRPSRGQALTNIDRPDKGVTWLLIPDRKTCMELPYRKPEGESHELQDLPISKNPRQKVGSERRQGLPCDKYLVKAGTNTWYLWTDQRNHAPVHLESPDKVMQIDWRNLKLAAPPNQLFEIPAGYTTTKL